ncbi:predicted protein [Pyrenophora tritici-repentis Pt-1C-BFP]|uniref:Uncharacterized protein n=1 Tax=Pyrenophora tritici-repentis (strain Pt-1C-BFP) TaxID=426418 RepID=B2WD34_PYRTR|nr:uncharacterized protein PTRG_07893 [Pyrenophora tritici-repentis Pt-1C-BFP]EDU50812.1 predicted protein [Pyrenophora tritici-repentis Pt-1C-BFP]
MVDDAQWPMLNLERRGVGNIVSSRPGNCSLMRAPQASCGIHPYSQPKVPGRRCPACLERGDTVWVIPGKCCPQCGTPVN